MSLIEENNTHNPVVQKKFDTKTKIKFGILLVIIVGFIFLSNYYNLGSYLKPEDIRTQINSFGYWGPIVFMAIYAIATIAFIPGTILTVTAGVIFGTFWGTLWTVIGATIGSIAAFLIARYLGKGFVEHLFHHKFPTLGTYNAKLERHGFTVNLFLRLVPIFPFNGLNYALGLTRMSFSAYCISTLIGIIPGSFVLAYFGNGLAELDAMNIIIAALLFIGLMLIYPIYKRFSKNK